MHLKRIGIYIGMAKAHAMHPTRLTHKVEKYVSLLLRTQSKCFIQRLRNSLLHFLNVK
jgi:hypothetical protein